jgi:hypothetical protein
MKQHVTFSTVLWQDGWVLEGRNQREKSLLRKRSSDFSTMLCNRVVFPVGWPVVTDTRVQYDKCFPLGPSEVT